MRWMTQLIMLTACAWALGVSGAHASQRFRGLDRDGDGVVTRAEWRGSDQSFSQHDWNRDGVLSGDEIRSASLNSERDETGLWDGAVDWTENRFAALDRNRDGRLNQNEWNVNAALFAHVDANHDGTVSRREFLGLEYDSSPDWGQRDEDDPDTSERFEQLDRNRDGVVTMNEWPRTERAFQRRDVDRSGAIEPDELPGGARQSQSGAYQSGYERGLTDGRQAGLEDKNGPNRWDLEGQRELVSADAGYAARLGSRQDYQAGYRAGFRVGYAEGFGRRR